MIRALTILGVILASGLAAAAEDLDASLIKRLSKGDVLRKLEPIPGSDQRLGVARGVVETSPEEAFRIATDYEHYTEFMPNTIVSEVKERTGEKVRFYSKLDMTWPIDDLEYECEVNFGPGNRSATYAMVPGTGKGVKTFSGEWSMTEFQGDKNRTLMIYKVSFLPERWYPGWAVRIGINNSLGQVIRAVKDRLKQVQQTPHP